MKNKEKYKQAFSAVRLSDDFSLEADQMKNAGKKMKINRAAACIAALALLFGSGAAAYAADVGGIQRTVQIWLNGEQTDVTIEFDGSGSYEMDYVDGEGNVQHRGGGGIAIGRFGKERPLTEEELLEEMNSPEVSYHEDGSVWIYWYDQKTEITDRFEDDVCRIKLVNGDETLYMTVQYRDGWSTSPRKFVDP